MYHAYDSYTKVPFKYSDKEYQLITRDGRIVVPRALQVRATKWYHLHLMHPGETRTELTLAQHYVWKGMRQTIAQVCKACTICKETKKRGKAYGLLPAKKTPEVIPWHTLCIDLVGPYSFGKKENLVELHCLTVIDPTTG